MVQVTKGSVSAEDTRKKRAEIRAEKRRLLVDTFINCAYLPLTVHWSTENSKFPDIGVGICGTLASIAQICVAWKATAQ